MSTTATRSETTAPPAAPPVTDDRTEGVRAVRGILVGVVLGGLAWVPIVVGVARLVG